MDTKERFEQVLRNFRTPDRSRWSKAAWASHRMRTIIRLLAIEHMCRERGIGVIPDRVLEALEILADFKQAHDKRYYVGRNNSRYGHTKAAFDPDAPIPVPVVPTDEGRFRRLMRAVEEFKHS